jgi:hypothetical protein
LQCGSEAGSSVTDLPSVGVNSHASPVPPGGGRRAADGPTSGRSHSEEHVRIYEMGGQNVLSLFSNFILLMVSWS